MEETLSTLRLAQRMMKVENKSEEFNLDKSKQDELLSILVSRLRQNKLNKIGEITYDKERSLQL